MLDINGLVYLMLDMLCNYISNVEYIALRYIALRYIFLDLKKGIKNDQKGNT